MKHLINDTNGVLITVYVPPLVDDAIRAMCVAQKKSYSVVFNKLLLLGMKAHKR